MPRHREGTSHRERSARQQQGGAQMKTNKLLGLITSCIVASAVFHARAESTETAKAASLRLATGQYITPTALRGSMQQFLNPGLSAYPNFVAGEAVRSQLSPDGTTLAVLCAGQNSLDKPDGTTDTANSKQFIFLYDVSGPHKQAPVLTQVIQQTNSHVGLVFSPDGKLYAAGGKDDAVYVYTKTGASWSRTATITLGHSKGVGIGVGPNASGLGISADGARGNRPKVRGQARGRHAGRGRRRGAGGGGQPRRGRGDRQGGQGGRRKDRRPCPRGHAAGPHPGQRGGPAGPPHRRRDLRG